MICIEGCYEDGDDEFYYEIYLRPWGQLWDDLDYPDDIPYHYDDWYLPLMEAGKSMPDAIGGEAVSSNSADEACCAHRREGLRRRRHRDRGAGAEGLRLDERGQ